MKKTLLLVLLLLVGCTTVQHIPKPNSNFLQDNKVRIKLTRSGEFQGSVIKLRIYDNGTLVGDIGINGILEWDRDSGPITITRDWSSYRGTASNNSVTFSTKRGNIYNVKMMWFGFVQSPKVTPASGLGITNSTEDSVIEDVVTGYNLDKIKKEWSQSGIEEIEGIYERMVGNNVPKYTLAIKRVTNTEYNGIFISDGNKITGSLWSEGQIKAKLMKTATPNVFKVKWYMSDKSVNENLYIKFETGFMKVFWPDDTQDMYLKLFPTSDSSIPSWEHGLYPAPPRVQ